MVTFFSILSMAAATVSLFIGTLVFFKNPRGYLNIVFLLLSYSASFWSFTEFEYRSAESITVAEQWLHLNFSWPLTGALFLHFALVYTRKDRLVRNPLTFVALYAPMLFFSISILLQQPYIDAPVKAYWGWTFLGDAQPTYYLAEITVSIFALAAVLICFIFHLRQPEGSLKNQAGFVTLGLTIPLVVGIFTDINIPGLEMFPEMAATSFAIGSSTFIGYAIWKYELFSITPATVADEIIKTMSDGLLLIDADCRIVFSNGAADEMLGYKKQQLQGVSMDEIFSNGADQQECQALLSDSTVRGAKAIEMSLRSRSGSKIPVSLSLSKIWDKDGNLQGFVCVARDISLRRQAEEALSDSEARYRTLFETSPDGISLVDTSGAIVMCNQTLADITGFKNPASMVGKKNVDLVVPEERQKVAASIPQVFAGGVRDMQFDALRNDGTTCPVEVSVTPVRDAEGEAVAMISVIRDISDRKRDEAALKQSKERYKAQYQGMPIPTYTWQRQGDDFVLTNCNDAAMAITHGQATRLIGSKASEAYTDDPQILIDMEECFLKKTPVNREITYRYHFQEEDETRNVSATYAFVPPDLVLVHAEDITDRKRAEVALRESEDRYRGLVETSPDAVSLTKIDGEIIFCNHQLARMMGYDSPDELIGRSASEMIAEEDRPRLLESVDLLSDICMATSVFNYVKKDGTRFPVETRGSLIRDAEGKPYAIITVARDITEREEAAQALRESEARYRELIDLSPDDIAVIDLEGNPLIMNQNAVDIHGYESLDEIMKVKFIELVAPASREKAASDFRTLAETGSLRNSELDLQRKDGSFFPAELSATSITDSEGKAVSFVCIARDISERKRSEVVLARQQADLAERNLELEALFAVSQAASLAQTTGELVSRVLDSVKQLGKLFDSLENAGIFLVKGDRLELAGYSGSHSQEFLELHEHLMIDDCLCGLAARTGEIVTSESSETDKRHIIRDPEKGDHGHIIVPLKNADRVMGVLYLYLPAGIIPLTDRRRRLLQSIGTRIAMSIENVELNEKTRELSLHDPLTGMANRRLMRMELEKCMARSKRTGTPHSVVMLDLDHFKDYNDRHGHTSGDKLLADIAGLIGKEIREVDLAARYGGEEFLIILADADVHRAIEVAERVRQAVSQTEFILPERRQATRMTVSLGVSTYDASTTQSDILVARADTALYRAKNNGRNRVESWLPGRRPVA